MSKVVLVTGGSRGIGAAVCRLAARDGYDVAINYRTNSEAAELVGDEVRQFGRRCMTVQADITDEHAVHQMFGSVQQELGPIEAFCSNGGVINAASPLADIPVAEIRRIIETDLTAHLICNREAVRHMAISRGGKGGVIVNMSSRASGLYGAGGFIPYGAAKGGIDVLTVGLGREVAADGIRVAALCPGLIETDIHDDTGVANRLERFASSVPMGRSGSPEEVAESVLWLMSDKASYVTATLFDVSGGR